MHSYKSILTIFTVQLAIACLPLIGSAQVYEVRDIHTMPKLSHIETTSKATDITVKVENYHSTKATISIKPNVNLTPIQKNKMQIQSQGGQDLGGGNAYEVEFKSEAQEILQQLTSLSQNESFSFDLEKLAFAIQNTQLIAATQLSNKNALASHDITKKIITFNTAAWPQLKSVPRRTLVLHEYLTVAGVSDLHDSLSQKLILQLSYSQKKPDKEHFFYDINLPDSIWNLPTDSICDNKPCPFGDGSVDVKKDGQDSFARFSYGIQKTVQSGQVHIAFDLELIISSADASGMGMLVYYDTRNGLNASPDDYDKEKINRCYNKIIHQEPLNYFEVEEKGWIITDCGYQTMAMDSSNLPSPFKNLNVIENEFRLAGLSSLAKLEHLKKRGAQWPIDLEKLREAIQSARPISTTKEQILHGSEKHAINSLSKRIITFNTDNWKKLDQEQQQILALHEYLRFCDVDDSNYALSSELVKTTRLSPKFVGERDDYRDINMDDSIWKLLQQKNEAVVSAKIFAPVQGSRIDDRKISVQLTLSAGNLKVTLPEMDTDGQIYWKSFDMSSDTKKSFWLEYDQQRAETCYQKIRNHESIKFIEVGEQSQSIIDCK